MPHESITPTKKSRSSNLKKLILKRIHILEWLPHYTTGDILADFIAGLTVGLTMMPQSIAYAGLAGLAPQYGLYTAFIGSFTYVFFGTIKEVSIGPTSLMSLITFSYIVGYPIQYMILLTFLAGCIELLMGILNLGFLIDFISPCVTSGFTSASAVIIIVAQLKHLFGIKVKSHDTFEAAKEILSKISQTRTGDLYLGIGSIIFLVCFKQLTKVRVKTFAMKKILWFLSISKNAFIVAITSGIAYYVHKNLNEPFKLTGPVPKGLPHFDFPSFSATYQNETVGVMDMVESLGSGIVVIPVIAVLSNVAIAKSYSGDVVVDASQEMITLGLSNILGSFIKAMPSCGAFTRSAVAASSDVRTPLQGVYSGTVIILALSFLAPYFFYIPKSSLAAVLITAASSLIDYEILPVLWRTNKIDLLMTVVTFFVGVIKGVETSILVGAIFNAIILLRMWSRPNVAVDVRSAGKNKEYINIQPELGLYYPAADYLTETVKKAHRCYPLYPIALDCTNVLKLDYAAAKTLQNLINTYNKKHIRMVLLNMKPEILDTLKTIMETADLHVCKTAENICQTNFGNIEEAALLPFPTDEKKCSLVSENERKVSVYEFQ